MASEIRVKLRNPVTVQASAAITAGSYSAGTETAIDNQYSAGTENGLGAEQARMTVNVTTAPSGGAATAEIYTAKYDDQNSAYETYEYALSVSIPDGTTGSFSAGSILLNSTLTKAKIKAVDYDFTASLIATPVTCEAQ